MRAYVAITPLELLDFQENGSFHATYALIADSDHSADLERDSDDQEELEFESSWNAAQDSRARQGSASSFGLVLAVDLVEEQLGTVEGNQVDLLSHILWPQVQSLLLADSEEPELSWFGAQEISTYLPQWLP